jgi:23S rRNA (guanosine2251-2'-O)-methyltransferase
VSEQVVLEGAISIRSCLQSGNRQVTVIYIDRDNERRKRSVAPLERLASANNIPIKRVKRTEIDQLASGTTHGGIVAVVGPRRFVQLTDLCTTGATPFIVMLDGIEDPYNFGAAVRALYAAGVDGLVVRPRNWMSAAGTVARSSAGASELIPTAIAESTLEAAAFFRGQGLVVACATKQHATPLYDTDLSVPLFLVIGGEKRGITRSFVQQSELRIQIPYYRDFSPSLGTASAVAVISFEVLRQRRNSPREGVS